MLMFGRLRIYGETQVTLFLNTMGDKVFSKIIGDIRTNASHMKKGAEYTEAEKGLLEFLKKNNLKYLNSIMELIQNKETVHSIILQPEVRKKIKQKRGEKTIFKYLASHVTVLTSNEIIHIREEKSKNLTMKQSYGTVSLIIPLDKVKKVEVWKGEDLKQLIVAFEDTHNLEFYFDTENEKVDDFVDKCNSFKK